MSEGRVLCETAPDDDRAAARFWGFSSASRPAAPAGPGAARPAQPAAQTETAAPVAKDPVAETILTAGSRNWSANSPHRNPGWISPPKSPRRPADPGRPARLPAPEPAVCRQWRRWLRRKAAGDDRKPQRPRSPLRRQPAAAPAPSPCGRKPSRYCGIAARRGLPRPWSRSEMEHRATYRPGPCRWNAGPMGLLKRLSNSLGRRDEEVKVGF